MWRVGAWLYDNVARECGAVLKLRRASINKTCGRRRLERSGTRRAQLLCDVRLRTGARRTGAVALCQKQARVPFKVA